ncbi:MAG TPA: hypothetical protein VF541_12125, partial [Longimicrobium sp.]
MPTPPVLDPRQAEDLVERLRRLAVGIPEAPGFVFGEWAGRDDAGMVLVRIFARMMELALERLNRVPQKNLLAFLDLVGVGLMPPAMARVPLTFTLARTAGAAGFLPRGTQVATVQSDNAPAVVFETEDDMVVHASRLVAAWSVDPAGGRFGERTGTVTGGESAAFPAFGGERTIEHAFYLGGGALFAGSAPRLLQLSLRLPQGEVDEDDGLPPWKRTEAGMALATHGAPSSAALIYLLGHVTWEAWRGGTWQPLEPQRTLTATGVDLAFPLFTGADEGEVAGAGLAQGVRDRWLRARLKDPFDAVFPSAVAATTARLAGVGGTVRRAFSGAASEGTPLPPDLVQLNTAVEDASGPFAAFGEAPRAGDTLYLASTETLTAPVDALSQAADTHLYVTLDHGDAQVRWEVAVWGYEAAQGGSGSFRGGGENGEPQWMPLAATGLPAVAALAEPGSLALAGFPDPPAGATHALYLLRATVTGGSHRRPPAVRGVTLSPPPSTGGTLALLSARAADDVIRFGTRAPALPQALTAWLGKLGNARIAESDFAGTGWSTVTPSMPEGPLMPFGTAPVPGSVVHLLHLRAVGSKPASLSFHPAAQTVRLAWEYHSVTGWKPLGQSSVSGSTGAVVDGTAAFTHGGTVAFPRVGDAAPVEVNGRGGHWLRVRVAGGDYGRGVEYAPVDPGDASKGVRVVPGTALLGGPVVASLSFGYQATEPALRMASHAHLEWRDHGYGGRDAGVSPFFGRAEPDPALYLGFDQPFADRPVSLYVSVPPRQLVE